MEVGDVCGTNWLPDALDTSVWFAHTDLVVPSAELERSIALDAFVVRAGRVADRVTFPSGVLIAFTRETFEFKFGNTILGDALLENAWRLHRRWRLGNTIFTMGGRTGAFFTLGVEEGSSTVSSKTCLECNQQGTSWRWDAA